MPRKINFIFYIILCIFLSTDLLSISGSCCWCQWAWNSRRPLVFTANLSRFIDTRRCRIGKKKKMHWNLNKKIFQPAGAAVCMNVYFIFNGTVWAFFFIYFYIFISFPALFSSGTVPPWLSLCQISEGECSICRMPTKKRDGMRGGGRWAKRIWLMRSASLYIHDYFLESIRETWLIQTVSLIGVLAVSAVDFPLSLAYFYGDLIFVLPVSSPAASLNRHRSSFIPGALLIDWMWQIMSIQLHLSSVLWLRWQSRIWLLVIRRWEFLPSHQNVLMSSDGISNFFFWGGGAPNPSSQYNKTWFAQKICSPNNRTVCRCFAQRSCCFHETDRTGFRNCAILRKIELNWTDKWTYRFRKWLSSARSAKRFGTKRWSLKTVKRWVSSGSQQRLLILLTPRLQPDRQWP